MGLGVADLKALTVIEADILLQCKEEQERNAGQGLSKFLKGSKGKGVQAVLDVGRAYHS